VMVRLCYYSRGIIIIDKKENGFKYFTIQFLNHNVYNIDDKTWSFLYTIC